MNELDFGDDEDFPEPELWCDEFCRDEPYHLKECPVAKKLRNCWCTPKWLADLIGPVAVDPATNDRAHIQAMVKIILEKGDTGIHDPGVPGSFRYSGRLAKAERRDVVFCNPPYGHGEVIRWVNHYLHTQFIFLLRWDPSTEWFSALKKAATHVWFPNDRLNFEPPPRIKSSTNPFPHALYMARPGQGLLERLATKGTLWLPNPLDPVSGKPQSAPHGHQPDDRSGSAKAGDPASGGGASANPGGGRGTAAASFSYARCALHHEPLCKKCHAAPAFLGSPP